MQRSPRHVCSPVRLGFSQMTEMTVSASHGHLRDDMRLRRAWLSTARTGPRAAPWDPGAFALTEATWGKWRPASLRDEGLYRGWQCGETGQRRTFLPRDKMTHPAVLFLLFLIKSMSCRGHRGHFERKHWRSGWLSSFTVG